MVTPATEETNLGTPVETVAPPEVGEGLTVPLLEGEEAAGPSAPLGTMPQEPAPMPTPAEPVLPTDIQERLQRGDQLEAQQRQQAQEGAIATELQGFVEEAARRGMTQEDVDWFSQTQTTTVRRLLTNFERTMGDREFYWGRQFAAYKIAREKGVDPVLLLDARDPAEMNRLADRELRYQDHETRIRTAEQRPVPSQNLNRTNTSRVGGQAVTSDNIDLLYNQGRVTADTYRRFLDTGQIR